MKPAHLKVFAVLIISFLGILIYSNSFLCSFHFDDKSSIVDNYAIRNISGLQNIWNYLPTRFIAYLSVALNYRFGGLNVFGYHLFNILIHLFSAIAVWWLTLLTFSTPAMKGQKISRHAYLIALFAGLIFVSHPIQTQGVTYIIQRTSSLAALFYILCVCLYAKSRLSGKDGISPLYYALSLLSAVIAMFTKEISATLPIAIALYEVFFFKNGKKIRWAYLAPFLITIFIIPVTIILSKPLSFIKEQATGTTSIFSLDSIFTQARVVMTYLRLLILPINQNLDYDYPVYKSLFSVPVLLSFFLLLAIFVLALLLYKRRRILSFAIFWFFITLAIESSFIPLKDVIFEHRLYLPMAGFSLFLVSLIYYLFENKTLKSMVVVLLIIISCSAVLTYRRNLIWKDELILWNDVVHKSPKKARPYNNRGLAYNDQGNFTQAIFDYNKAIEISPNFVEAYNNRGIAHNKQGNIQQAFPDYNKAIKINPNHADAYNNRGLAYNNQGNFTQAISDCTKAIKINPNHADAYNNRGLAYNNQGNFTQAISDCTKAIAINPNHADAYNNRGIAYYLAKEYDKAWADVHKAGGLGYAVNPVFLNALKKASGMER